MSRISLSIISVFLPLLLFAGPGRVIVIPEAEGAPSHQNVRIGPRGPKFAQALNAKGQRTAAAYVNFFLGSDSPFPDLVTTNLKNNPKQPITFVGAASTLGAIQTVAPLANVIFSKKAPVSVYTYVPETVKQYSPNQISSLKDALRSQETAVICWPSKGIPTLLKELEPKLKSDPSFQAAFRANDSAIFVITYAPEKPLFNVFTLE